MNWKPFNSGTPYTCKDCPAYAELQDEIERLQEELEASKTAIRGWIEMLGEK
jgi:hypothetical protein